MKKLILSIMALATMTFAFTSCEDVPEPYALPTEGTNTTAPAVEPMGTGTQADPYNVTAALAKIKAQEADKNSEPMYVKGKICEITSVETATFGNATYYISDDGTNNVQSRLYIYQSMYLGNTKFTSEDQIKVGDEVIVYGPFVLYKGSTPETAGKGASYIYSLNGKAEGGTTAPTKAEPKGTGTEADPYNAAGAAKAAGELDATGKITGAYVSGIISKIESIDTGNFGNATYYISEDGTEANQFLIYRGYYLKGEKFTSADQIKTGDKVVIKGDLVNFKGNTVEMTQGSQIISINAQGGSTATTGLKAPFKDGMDNFTINDISKGEGLTYVWQHDSSHGYMKASAYKDKKNIAAVSEIVSPAFSLEGLAKATLSFQHTGRFFTTPAEDCKVFASTDKKTWTELTVSAYPTGQDWNFVDATCDMSKFAGQKTVYIAFRYTSTTNGAATWEVKNVEVK